MKLVFATNNLHKIEEARAILGKDIEIVSLKEAGIHAEIPETADTLEGNSLLKAQYIAERFGMDCFADDTGLEVVALNGAPGVFSARYAGEPSDPAANRKKLLEAMKNETNRQARFRTVVTLIRNGQVKQGEGVVDGTLATEEHGLGGFGYDSLFIPEGYTQTFAELTPEQKNSISHRARAMQALCRMLDTERD